MVCNNCGNENADGTKFCIFCGKPLEAQAPAAAPQATQAPAAAPQATQAPVAAPQMPTAPVQNNMMPNTAPMQNGMPMQGMPNGAPVQNNMMSNGVPMQNGMPMQGMPNGAPMQNNMMSNGTPMQGGIPMGNPMQHPMGAPMQGTMPASNPNGGIPVGRPVATPYSVGAVPPANPTQKKGGAAKVVIILLIILILLGVGAVAFIFISKGMENKKIDDALQNAQELAESGSYEDAEEAYLKVLEMQSDNAEAIDGLTANYIAWADDCVADGDYEGALAVLEGADSQAKRKTIKEAITEIQDEMASQTVAPGSSFGNGDLVFIGSSDSIQVEKNHAIIVYTDATYYTEYATGDYDEYAEEYMTARGLELGMTLEDYLTLYAVKEGYAAWELYSGSSNEYTSFVAYTGQDPDDMYYDYNNVWLDIGYCKENGEWRQLEDWEIQDTWFCDADLDDYEEVIVFAVNFNDWNEVKGISLEYFTYDDAWAEWQGWAE